MKDRIVYKRSIWNDVGPERYVYDKLPECVSFESWLSKNIKKITQKDGLIFDTIETICNNLYEKLYKNYTSSSEEFEQALRAYGGLMFDYGYGYTHATFCNVDNEYNVYKEGDNYFYYNATIYFIGRLKDVNHPYFSRFKDI